MFERLAQLVEEVEIPVDGDAIAEAMAVRDKLEAAIADALAAFDKAQLWEIDGARSLTDWVRARGRSSRASAARLCTQARRVDRLPVTKQAWRDGTLSSGQVQAVMANVSDQLVDLFAAHEADLVPVLAPLNVRDTAVAMQEWKRRIDDDEPEEAEQERELFLSQTFGGRYGVDGDLDPVGGQTLETALRLAGAEDYDGERTPARRRADALVDICQFFLDHHAHPAGSRHRPHVNLVINAERVHDHGGARFVDGTPVDPTDAATFMCDAVISRVMASGSTILDYGRATRDVSVALFNALVLRDQHCRFPDCDARPSRCDAHHVTWWEHGGDTALDNLALQCRRHHRTLHKRGWEAKLRPDGTFEVTDPNGHTRSSRPPGPVGGLF